MSLLSRQDQAFEDYFRLGAHRSLRQLYEHYVRRRDMRLREGVPGVKEDDPTILQVPALDTIQRWSRTCKWQDRIAEREQEIREAERRALLKAAADRERQRAAERVKMEGVFVKMGEAGVNAAYRALLQKVLLTTQDIDLGDGKVLKRDPDAVSPPAIVAFLAQSAEMWARGLGVGARIAKWETGGPPTDAMEEAPAKEKMSYDDFRTLYDQTISAITKRDAERGADQAEHGDPGGTSTPGVPGDR